VTGGIVRGAAAALRGPRAPFVLAILACTLLAVWLVYPVTRPGMIVNQDAPRHLLRTKVMVEQFLPSGHVDGWSPYWYLGAQLFLFQSYGYFAVIGAAALLLQSLLSMHAVFKLFYVLPIVVLPAAVAYLARRSGLTRGGAAVAALAALIFGTNLGYGMAGLFRTGLLIQAAGIVVFALAWPAVLDALDGVRHALWKASLLLGAMLVVHFISGAYALAAAGVVAAALSLWRRDVGVLMRYVMLAAIVLLLAGHSIFPALELREYGGFAVGWGERRTRDDEFLRGELLGPRVLVLCAYAAGVWAILFDRGRLAMTALLLFGTGAVAVSGPFWWEPAWLQRALSTLVRPRAVPYACLFAALMAGLAFERVRAGFTVLAQRGLRPHWMLALALALALGAAAVAMKEAIVLRRHVHTEATHRGPGRREFLRVVRWLREHAPPQSVIAVDRRAFDFAHLGVRSVISMLNLRTGVYTLGGDQAELSAAAARSPRGPLNDQDQPERVAERLRAYGVSHLIVTTAAARERYDASGDFSSGYRDRNATIYEVERGGVRLHGKAVSVLRSRYTPELARWTVRTKAGGKAVAAISPHPNWKATVSGRPVALSAVPDSLLSLELPPGMREVELVYERRWSERLYNWISLVTLVGVLVAWRRGRHSRDSVS